MKGHVETCVERYCELAHKSTDQLSSCNAKPCLDDHQSTQDAFDIVGDLAAPCAQTVLKCFFLARNGRPDMLWTVDALARAVTKLKRVCDKRLARLISYLRLEI